MHISSQSKQIPFEHTPRVERYQNYRGSVSRRSVESPLSSGNELLPAVTPVPPFNEKFCPPFNEKFCSPKMKDCKTKYRRLSRKVSLRLHWVKAWAGWVETLLPSPVTPDIALKHQGKLRSLHSVYLSMNSPSCYSTFCFIRKIRNSIINYPELPTLPVNIQNAHTYSIDKIPLLAVL